MGKKDIKIPKSVKKRFKITKNGKVLRRSTHSRHLKANKTSKRKRRQSRMKKVEGRMAKKIKKVLGEK